MVEGARLESGYAGNRIVSSNLIPSANIQATLFYYLFPVLNIVPDMREFPIVKQRKMVLRPKT